MHTTVATKYSVVNMAITVLCTTPSYIVCSNTHHKDFIPLDQIGQDLDVFASMTAHTTKTLKKLKQKIHHHNLFTVEPRSIVFEGDGEKKTMNAGKRLIRKNYYTL